MPPESSAEKCCVLLQTPLPLKLIVRIKVTARTALKDAEQPTEIADQDVSEDDPALVNASVHQVLPILTTNTLPIITRILGKT